MRLAHPVTVILLQPGGSEATHLGQGSRAGGGVFTELRGKEMSVLDKSWVGPAVVMKLTG